MDFVNQGLMRLSELTKSLSPGARLVSVLAILGIACGIAWSLGARTDTPSETYLMGGEAFTAAQLREMEAALGQAALLDYQIDGMRIRVPQGQQARYMAALAEAGALPAEFGHFLRSAVEQSSFMLSGSRQQAQLKVAVQQELQSVINHFQGIERSSVQIAEEISQGFPSTKTVTASVSVQSRTGQPIDQRAASAIRCIVAQSWGGLKPENVTVVDLNSGQMFSGPIVNEPSAGDYAQLKKQFELDWQEKIARLIGIPGAIVSASVELTADGREPRAVSVAVAIPQAHLAGLWQQQYGAPPGGRAVKADPALLAELETSEHNRIKAAILPLLLTADPAVDRASLVAVSTLHAGPEPLAAEVGYERLAVEWLVVHWENLGLGLLVVVALLLMRSTFQSAKSKRGADALNEPAGAGHSLYLVTEDETPVQVTSSRTDELRPSELSERIRRDPQAAASVLKNWIGHAS